MKLYHVLHHEIFSDHSADEMLFYTCDSLKKAMSFIKKAMVDEWSWREIQVSELNVQEWPERVGLYDLKGKELKKINYEKYYRIYDKKCKNKQLL